MWIIGQENRADATPPSRDRFIIDKSALGREESFSEAEGKIRKTAESTVKVDYGNKLKGSLIPIRPHPKMVKFWTIVRGSG
jgi:hypothetical protein